jgi:hypothetical protein
MIKVTITILFFLVIYPIFAQEYSENYYNEILKESDFYRGSQIEGISWNLKVENFKADKIESELRLIVEASTINDSQYALITFLQPQKNIGQKLLLRNHNMFFMKKGLRQPISISGRQRLSGSAANADIISCNYFTDYKITNIYSEKINSKDCWKFDLYAKSNQVSYYMINYWIIKNTNQAIKAEYYGKNGHLIKTAYFEYNNSLIYKSKKHFFISQIDIYDNLRDGYHTILKLSEIKLQEYNYSKFLKENMN